MQATSFTPGPWKFYRGCVTAPQGYQPVVWCGFSDDYQHADILVIAPLGTNIYPCSAESDAYLIAAAPQMYAFIEEWLRSLRPYMGGFDGVAAYTRRNLARALLADARGETP